MVIQKLGCFIHRLKTQGFETYSKQMQKSLTTFKRIPGRQQMVWKTSKQRGRMR